MQTSFGDLKEPVTFHEALPVSEELIRPVFVICGTLVGLAVMGFLVENGKIIISFGKRLGQRLWQGLVYFGKIAKRLVKSGRQN